jgi:hypothetical protein
MVAGISRCLSIADERTFLDCVYGAAQPVRAELGLPPAPQSQTNLVPRSVALEPTRPVQSAPASQQNSGLFSRIFGSGKIETASSPIAAYVFNDNGLFTVTLENGEVWRQADGDSRIAYWRKPASNYVVTVRSGALGSAYLEVRGETGVYKVRRIR